MHELAHGQSQGRRLAGEPSSADAPTCYISDDEECAFDGLAAEQATMVYPGGSTHCLFSYSSDYAFQVIPGSKSKLLIHFQGGGSCWDKQSTTGNFGSMCTDSIYQEPGWAGIFRRGNTTSPFKDYTVVVVLYCSGDMHMGNAVQPFLDQAGERVQQKGYANTRSVVDWALKNFGGELESFAVSGSSAGAIGAQFWAGEMLGSFKYTSAMVIADSLIGIFPAGTEGPLLQRFGACSGSNGSTSVVSQLFPGGEVKCDAAFTFHGVLSKTMAKFPEVAFALVTARSDMVQIAYHDSLALSFGKQSFLTSWDFLVLLTQVLHELNQSPNFVAYVVDGTSHQFLPTGLLYTTGTSGVAASKRPGTWGRPLLLSWLTDLVTGASVTGACYGEQRNQSFWQHWDTCACPYLCDWGLTHKVLGSAAAS